MKVAIQGIAGSFHAQAAQQRYGSDVQLIECETFRDVFRAVANNSVDRGVVAIENSLHGSINPVYRLLSQEKLWVCGEERLKIEMFLLGGQKTIFNKDSSSIGTVLSQVPALEQCEQWLDEHLPKATRQEYADTAQSVQYVVNQTDRHDLAAIAGKQAAELYGARVLAGPINDDPDNYTRFVFLSKMPEVDKAANRTSIILTEPTDRPGALYEALGYFAEAGINLSKLDSHPLVGKQRRYAFYIDFDCAMDSPPGVNIVKQLEASGWTVQILGSYQAAS